MPYRIRRSDRARRARIQVSADGVEVVVPRRLPMREVEPFVEEKRPWIERTLRRMRQAEAELSAEVGHRAPVLEPSHRTRPPRLLVAPERALDPRALLLHEGCRPTEGHPSRQHDLDAVRGDLHARVPGPVRAPNGVRDLAHQADDCRSGLGRSAARLSAGP